MPLYVKTVEQRIHVYPSLRQIEIPEECLYLINGFELLVKAEPTGTLAALSEDEAALVKLFLAHTGEQPAHEGPSSHIVPESCLTLVNNFEELVKDDNAGDLANLVEKAILAFLVNNQNR